MVSNREKDLDQNAGMRRMLVKARVASMLAAAHQRCDCCPERPSVCLTMGTTPGASAMKEPMNTERVKLINRMASLFQIAGVKGRLGG